MSGTTLLHLINDDVRSDQRRTLTLVRPYSKILFQEAVRADCNFLARCNIMDYSYVVTSCAILHTNSL